MESRRSSIERDKEEKFEESKMQEQMSYPLENARILVNQSEVEKNGKNFKKSKESKSKGFDGILTKSTKNIDNPKDNDHFDSHAKKRSISPKNENTENLMNRSLKDEKAYFVLNNSCDFHKKQMAREKGSKRSKFTNSLRYKKRLASPGAFSRSSPANCNLPKKKEERTSQPSCWLKEDRMPYLRDTCDINLNSSCCLKNEKNCEPDCCHIPVCSSSCSNHMHTPYYYSWCDLNHINFMDNHENNINSNSCTVLGKCTNENSKEKMNKKQTSDYQKSNLFSKNTIQIPFRECYSSRNFKSFLKKVSMKNKIPNCDLPFFFKSRQSRISLNLRRRNYFLLKKKKKRIKRSLFTQNKSDCIPALKLENQHDCSIQVDMIPSESKSISCNISNDLETNFKSKKNVTFYEDNLIGTQSKSNLQQNNSAHSSIYSSYSLKPTSQNILNDINSTKLLNYGSYNENIPIDNPVKKSDFSASYDKISKPSDDFILPWINSKSNIYNKCMKPSSKSLILAERCLEKVTRPNSDEKVELASDSSGCEDAQELMQHALTAVQRARLAFSPKDLLTLNPSQAPGPSPAVLKRIERLAVRSTRLPGMPPRSDLILRTSSPRSRSNLRY